VAEHAGPRTRLKPGMEEAYDTAHAAVWPELLAATRAAGFTRSLRWPTTTAALPRTGFP
jgi:L-rhamnose mutarotase